MEGHHAKCTRLFLLCALLATTLEASGFEIDTYSELRLRWDTRVAYIGGARLEDQDPRLLENISKDDVNRNFDRGLISNRVFVESKLAVAYGLFGAHIGGQGLYDSVYLGRNDHDSPDTSNQTPYNEFNKGTRDVLGKRAELQDAYATGEFALAGYPMLFSVGRQTLAWGHTLFYPQNGIWAAMAPFDVAKATKDPTESALTADQVGLPLLQAAAQVVLPWKINLSGFYQFEWAKSRFEPAGAYLSGSDVFDEGGERTLVRAGNESLNALANYYLVRTPDIVPPDDGQGGLRLQWSFPSQWLTGELDLYALQFHSREPSFYIRLEPGAVPVNPGGGISVGNLNVNATQAVLNAALLNDGRLGEYAIMYGGPRARLYGLSFKTEFRSFLGTTYLSGETSYRARVPLVSRIIQTTTPLTALSADEPLHAIGDTVHAQLSIVALQGRARLLGLKLWDRGLVLGEIAWQKRSKVRLNSENLDTDREPEAAIARLQFTPTWRRVFDDQVDLSLIASVAHTLHGNSGVMLGFAGDGDDAGEARAGLRLKISEDYTVGLHFSHFYGGSDKQDRADKDYLAWGVSANF